MHSATARRRFRPTAATAALAMALGSAFSAPSPAAAQDDADFLFGTPRVAFGVYGGVSVAGANSEIFDFTRQQLTIDKGDFTAPLIGGELSIRAAERVDVALNVGVARSETRSEFRHWVDNLENPIEQTTVFLRVPVTLGAKVYLMDRGRSIGRFAWIPAGWAPYAGAGAGFTYYNFDQEGDWVDFETLDVFPDRFRSEGGAPTAYVRGGADISLGPRFLVTLDGRYTWADAVMEDDFVGFDDIDLGGFDATVGFAVRF